MFYIVIFSSRRLSSLIVGNIVLFIYITRSSPRKTTTPNSWSFFNTLKTILFKTLNLLYIHLFRNPNPTHLTHLTHFVLHFFCRCFFFLLLQSPCYGLHNSTQDFFFLLDTKCGQKVLTWSLVLISAENRDSWVCCVEDWMDCDTKCFGLELDHEWHSGC